MVGRSVMLAALLAAGGCSLISRAPAPATDLSGRYEGVLRLEGDDIDGGLTIEQDGGRVNATLATEVGIAAEGRGTLEGTVLRIELDYGAECEGTLKLAGQALEGGTRLAGTVEAEDCTGPATGSFSFSRR
jgi:hypothetical protein